MRPFNDLTARRQASKRWLARLPLPGLDHKGIGNGVEPPDVRYRRFSSPSRNSLKSRLKRPLASIERLLYVEE
jgi:hypothetical protein